MDNMETTASGGCHLFPVPTGLKTTPEACNIQSKASCWIPGTWHCNILFPRDFLLGALQLCCCYLKSCLYHWMGTQSTRSGFSVHICPMCFPPGPRQFTLSMAARHLASTWDWDMHHSRATDLEGHGLGIV